MKRLFTTVLAAILALNLTGCGIESREEQVLDTLGQYEYRHFYTSGGFQDYTDFALYTYAAADLTDNPYFAPLTGQDTEALKGFLDNFEGWVDIIGANDPSNELVVNYAFDRTILDSGDWFYLYEGENYPKYGCYDLWIFDSQTNVLYYFHNNI